MKVLAQYQNDNQAVFEIGKWVVIKSAKAPVISVEPLANGKFRLITNSDFVIDELVGSEIVKD